MKDVIIEHDSPGGRGVTQIMGLSDAEALQGGAELTRATRQAALGGGLLALVGLVTGKGPWLHLGAGIAAGGILVNRLTRGG